MGSASFVCMCDHFPSGEAPMAWPASEDIDQGITDSSGRSSPGPGPVPCVCVEKLNHSFCCCIKPHTPRCAFDKCPCIKDEDEQEPIVVTEGEAPQWLRSELEKAVAENSTFV